MPHSSVGSIRDAAAPDLSTRFVAALIDGVIASILGFLLGWIPLVGGMVGGLYVIARDGVEIGPVRYRSVGKYVMGLRPQRLDGQPMDLETSVRRNWILGLSVLVPVVSLVPFLGGLLSGLISVTAFIMVAAEIYFLVTTSDQRRWGDRFAGTRVTNSNDALV